MCFLVGVFTSSPPTTRTWNAPVASRYPVAAWLNRLAPPADEIVFEPVAPLKAVVLPSELRPA